MKTSAILGGNAIHAQAQLHDHRSLFEIIRADIRAMASLLNRIGTAIALGEAGDLEGAKKWRDAHDQH